MSKIKKTLVEHFTKDSSKQPAQPPQTPKGPFTNDVRGFFALLKKQKYIRDNFLQFAADNVERYGDIFVLYYTYPSFRPVYFLRRPSMVSAALVEQYENVEKSSGHKLLSMLLGEGLLTSDEPAHRVQRRAIQPRFHSKRIDSYCQHMVAETKKHFANLPLGKVLDIHEEMHDLTMKIVTRTLFDMTFSGEVEKIQRSTDVLGHQLYKMIINPLSFILLRLPVPATLKIFYHKHYFHRVINTLVAEKIKQRALKNAARKKQDDDQDQDLLSMLLEIYPMGKNKKQNRASLKMIRDQALTFFLAGHETTANALAWAWYLIDKNPRVRKKMQAEIAGLLGDKDANKRDLTLADLGQLPYTQQVFKETLRLYPTAWVIGRHVVKDFTMDGYNIKNGDELVFSPYLSHRDPRYFKNPEEFLPERWTAEFEKQLPRGAYYPFGAGPRFCIGWQFAQMEGAVVLAQVLRDFTLTLKPANFKPELFSGITLKPKNGMPMMLAHRALDQ
ncbi:MAG: cytochrome P450 [Hydrotalea sp.]|nr:cytochrome P450 [Hydrotalea sp.]